MRVMKPATATEPGFEQKVFEAEGINSFKISYLNAFYTYIMTHKRIQLVKLRNPCVCTRGEGKVPARNSATVRVREA